MVDVGPTSRSSTLRLSTFVLIVIVVALVVWATFSAGP